MKNIRYFIAMDCSGSMGISKRNRSRAHFQKLTDLLKPFEQAEPIYSVLFSTTVRSKGFYYANNMDSFFGTQMAGGTYMSVGLEPIIKEIHETPEDIMNIVVVYSDGDNWSEDNETFVNKVIEITKKNTMFIYVNVSISTYIPTVIQHLKDAHDYFGDGVVIYQTMTSIDMDFTDEAIKTIIDIIKGETPNENA